MSIHGCRNKCLILDTYDDVLIIWNCKESGAVGSAFLLVLFGQSLSAAEAYLVGCEKCGMSELFCYVSINGSVYHVSYDCGQFGKSKFGYDAATKYRITIEDAKYLGYSPCSFCSR